MAFGNIQAKRTFAATPQRALSTAPLYARLEDLLASGGDGRIGLAKGVNRYGCAPCPQDQGIDFSSSTAASISEAGYARAAHARLALLADAAMAGVGEAFSAAVARARAELKRVLDLPERTGVVFAASGTDTQLSALFLTRARLAGPMTVIIVGADQTGSGTVHTARARHFDTRTARDVGVSPGRALAALGDELRCVEIAFTGADGVRDPDDLEEMVRAATAEAIARGDKVLLQAMDSSKLGWCSPGLACLTDIAARWPGQVQIVIDACQLRCGRTRLKTYLDSGFLVLITGSKFFTGPAFSGALLTPAGLDAAFADIATPAQGLYDYAGQSDWPENWPLRNGFSDLPNYGQWLRWEAALAEMDAYYAVPCAARRTILVRLARGVGDTLQQTDFVKPVNNAPDARRDTPTIFSVLPQYQGRDLPPGDCAILYRALGADIAFLLPHAGAEERQLAGLRCRIGQPVRLGTGAVLRLAISTRHIRGCWKDRSMDEAAIAAIGEQLAQTLAKMELVLRHLPVLTEHFKNA